MGRIDWIEIEHLPEEWKDGRRLLLAGGSFYCDALKREVTDPITAQWSNGWWLIVGTQGGYDCVFYESPTHFAEINAPDQILRGSE